MKSKRMKLLVLLNILLSLKANSMQITSPPSSSALPGCSDKCGNLTVPYPFGTIGGCAKDYGFLLTCDNTSFDSPQLALTTPYDRSTFRVADISPNTLTISYTKIAKECYNNSLPKKAWIVHTHFVLDRLPYTISHTRNKMTVIGCDSFGISQVREGYSTGCFSYCSNTTTNIPAGKCTGEGCCQAPIGKGAKLLVYSLTTRLNHTTTQNISNCSYSFPVESDWFNFTYADVTRFSRNEVPVVLEWAIGNDTCAVASRTAEFACVGDNTTCVDAESGEGYRCHCKEGYEGNPYLSNGCRDIDECNDPNTNLCSDVCTNAPGNYTCSCPKGTDGDGRKDGKGCTKTNSKFPLAAQITLGVGLGIMAILATASILYYMRKKRQYILLKEKYFERNGGMLLLQQMSKETGHDAARIFSERELSVATAGFSRSRILGEGGNGTVYKGHLPDGRVIAIKKSKAMDQTQMDQFVNEIMILSKVIHRNVVKILGCCLETEVPLLVYEYIPNGTLYDQLHSRRASQLSWEKRLCIAAETAGAIAYLHSDLSRPIIHRDIKSANILLDYSFTAKVADFGASRLAPTDVVEVTTKVQGTLVYLDPEYMQTAYLTAKSDVYSFGVVLAELLTGEKSISFSRAYDLRLLATFFLVTIKEDQLTQILHPSVRVDSNMAQVMAVTQIAKRCLGVMAEERPSMKEVASELERLRGYGAQPVSQVSATTGESSNREASVPLLVGAGGSIDADGSSVVREVDWTMDLER